MPAPKLPDYSAIKFPSDRITVADLRRAHPDRFDSERGSRFDNAGADPSFALDTILFLERLVAKAAYLGALGESASVFNEDGLDRADCVKELTQFYGTYQVAAGASHAEQLVRDIETQAARQAFRGR